MVGRVILPILSDAGAQGQRDTVVGILRSLVAAYAVAVLPVSLGIVMASSELMRLYGVAFASEGAALALVAIAAAFAALCIPVGQAIAAEGRMWLGLGANFLSAATFVVGAIAMLDAGARGVGLALAAAYLIQFMVAMGIARVALRRC